MTPIAIALTVLCAVLAVTSVLLYRSAQRWLDVIESSRHTAKALRGQIARDAAIHADTFRLLRDPRARAKNVRHDAWLAELETVEEKWRAQ
jgi:hypothetical protein